jgi:hypothetical protein
MTSGTKYASPPGHSRAPRKSVALQVKLRSCPGNSEFVLPFRLVYGAVKGSFQLEMYVVCP